MRLTEERESEIRAASYAEWRAVCELLAELDATRLERDEEQRAHAELRMRLGQAYPDWSGVMEDSLCEALRTLARLRAHPSLDAVLRVIGGGSGGYAECAALLLKLLRGGG